MKTPKTHKKTKPNDVPGMRVKLSFRRHFLPPLGGLIVFVLIFGFFNSQWISGQIAYRLSQRNQSTSTKVITTTTTQETTPPIHIDENAPPKIGIPKIAVDAPVVYGQTVIDEKAFQRALRDGVVHYPATATPGELGNVVIFGHSSGQWWAPGNYKFVFSLLDKLVPKDQITLDYRGIRYVYEVTGTRIVVPEDVSVLKPSDDHRLTLITCTPVGSNKKRLIIDAKQISPSTTPPVTTTTKKIVPEKETLPGNAPSFWENLTSLF